ncbi:MAG: choice-of-anchor tandem repeat NxxGxxAF-containing protein [Phycisphaerales bacterium JB063]
MACVWMSRSLVAPWVLAAMSGLTPYLASAGTYETMVLSGTPAPGTEAGTTFWIFQGPAINNAGEISFGARLQGLAIVSGVNDSGVWTMGAEGISFVGRNGDSAVGTDAGVLYGPVSQPQINETGQYYYSSTMTGPGVTTENNRAVWINRTGSQEILLREGDAAAGLPAGLVYTDVIQTFLNDLGHFAFRSNLTGPGVNDTNNHGIWTDVGGSFALLARAGDAAPGTEPGVTFSLLSLAGLNNQGRVLLYGRLEGNSIDQTNNSGIWTDIGGTLGLMVRAGDEAPGVGPSVSFGGMIPSTGFGMNGAEQVVFSAHLSGPGIDVTNRTSIWVGSQDTLRLVVQYGKPIPGVEPGVVLQSSFDLVLNDLGQVAFGGYLDGPDIDLSNDGGLWFEQDGILTLIARDGEQAVGTQLGTVYRAINGHTLNDTGQIAFRAVLTGDGVDENNDRAVYATDTNGELILVAREGELFDVDDDPLTEDLRTISSANAYVEATGMAGRSGSFNDHGQLGISLGFTDGTWGIFIANTESTLTGDINGDGFVGVQDLDILLANWGDAVGMRATASGDLSGDGIVGQADLDIVTANWGTGDPLLDVPEPGSLALLSLGGLALLRRRP